MTLEEVDESGYCTHPHDALHPGRVDGSTTVCFRCEQIVAIQPRFYLNGKSPKMQYKDMLERLQAPALHEG